MPVIPQSQTPKDLQFAARRKSFDIEDALASDWHGDSAFVTAWFNAMSLLFPLGEKFFIDSVIHFEKQIKDPQLKTQIASFRAQESMHRIEHQKYNEILCSRRGYSLERFEKKIRTRLAWVLREMSPRRRLAGTVASEHLTAIMAHYMLSEKDSIAAADPTISQLWTWHGVEETEHKAVAFDVFVAVGGTIAERRRALLWSTFFFFKDVMRNLCIMLQSDGKLWSISEWVDGFRFLFIKPGVLRRVSGDWLNFLRSDFHPWQIDNRDLIQNWESEQKSAVQSATTNR